jgi:hypothetical protein
MLVEINGKSSATCHKNADSKHLAEILAFYYENMRAAYI